MPSSTQHALPIDSFLYGTLLYISSLLALVVRGTQMDEWQLHVQLPWFTHCYEPIIPVLPCTFHIQPTDITPFICFLCYLRWIDDVVHYDLFEVN